MIIKEIIKKYFEKEGVMYYLPLKDKGGKLKGGMSNFKREDYEKLGKGEEVYIKYKDKKTKKEREYTYKFKDSYEECEYYEINMNVLEECIIVIDIDESSIINYSEEDKEEWIKGKIPEKIRELPYTISRNKRLPHYWCILEGVEKEILKNNVKILTNCLTFCNGDISASHIWERSTSDLKNYKDELPIIKFDDIKEYIKKDKINNFKNIEIKSEKTEEIYNYKRRSEKKEEIKDTISEISDITEINTIKENRIEIIKLTIYLEGLSEERSNNYESWTRVVWCINNICKSNNYSMRIRNELIHNFSKKSIKYEEIKVDDFIENHIKEENGVLGVGSLIMWYNEDNNEDKLLNQILKNRVRDSDMAKYIKEKLGERFVCADIKNEIWYRFERNRWVEDEGGYTILNKISNEIPKEVEIKLEKIKNRIINIKNNEIKVRIKEEINQCEKFLDKCRNNSGKKNLLKELKILYNKEKFVDKLDMNPYLLCCNNGIIDIKKKEFREGKPEDMCSLTTGYDYKSLEEIKNDEELKEKYEKLKEFFEQVFVIEGIREYIYEHLASSLIGVCKEQDFNYYIGKGSNAKTMLVKLMSLMLGDYYGVVPTSLICSKKVDIGSCSSEIALLRGKRYVVMQEPSKNEVINDGTMKELTGENEIYCNPKYKTPFFYTPMFHLIICANFTLDIKSNDNGTWRRIKIVEFLSKFKEDPDEEEIFEFNKDINLIENFKDWKVILLAILVEKAYILKGKVNENIYVKNATIKYREEQDRIGQYIKECLIITNKKEDIEEYEELLNNFKEWYEHKYNYKIGIKILLDRLEDEYNIKVINKKINGLKLINITNESIEKSEEEIFIEEFKKDFEISYKKIDYIRSIRLSEWSKKKNLNIYTSKTINKILNSKLDYNTKDNLEKKSIDGIKTWILNGIREKIES